MGQRGTAAFVRPPTRIYCPFDGRDLAAGLGAAERHRVSECHHCGRVYELDPDRSTGRVSLSLKEK